VRHLTLCEKGEKKQAGHAWARKRKAKKKKDRKGEIGSVYKLGQAM